MKARTKNAGILIIGMIFLNTLFRCAPIASEMQSARLVGRKQVEFTPTYSTIKFREVTYVSERKEAAPEVKGQLLGLQAAYGVSDKMDLRLRIERVEFRGVTKYVVATGPKVSLVKDRIALYVPVWFVDFKPAQTQPTVLFTLPLMKNKVDFNPSAKTILSMGGYDPMNTVMIAVNAGFAISTDLSRWALRPEYGVVYDLKGGNRFGSFSIGFSMKLKQRSGHR